MNPDDPLGSSLCGTALFLLDRVYDVGKVFNKSSHRVTARLLCYDEKPASIKFVGKVVETVPTVLILIVKACGTLTLFLRMHL